MDSSRELMANWTSYLQAAASLIAFFVLEEGETPTVYERD